MLEDKRTFLSPSLTLSLSLFHSLSLALSLFLSLSLSLTRSLFLSFFLSFNLYKVIIIVHMLLISRVGLYNYHASGVGEKLPPRLQRD